MLLAPIILSDDVTPHLDSSIQNVVGDLLYNNLTKKEQKIYSNLSFEEMYNLVTGDNSLRGITINDSNLYVENNEE